MRVLSKVRMLKSDQLMKRKGDELKVQDYSIKEVASILALSVTTIHTLERRKLLRRVENPNYKQEGIRYRKEHVDALLEEQKKLVSHGLSVNELAKQFGVYPAKIKKALNHLNLEVERVRTSLSSERLDYVLTPEQEIILTNYFTKETETLPKRNHFYQAHVDVALYQLFIVEDTESVRLVQNSTKQVGFQVENEEFILYSKALRTMRVEPCYAIHHPLKKEGTQFITLELPVEIKAFYQVVDILYSTCGIENFYVVIRNHQAIFAVRNGDYQLAAGTTPEGVNDLQAYVVSGQVSVTKNLLRFAPTTKTFEVKVKNELVDVLRKRAEREGMKLNDFLQQIIQEKTNEVDR